MKRSKRDRRTGFALIMVMAQLTLLFSCWSIANRNTGAILQLENALSGRVQRDKGSLTAVARGLRFLEAGPTPSSPSSYSLTLKTPQGEVAYLVTFTELEPTQWQVEAVPLTPANNPGNLPELPSPIQP